MSDDVNRSSSLVINDKLLGTKIVYIAHNLYLVAETHQLNQQKNLEGVNVGTIFTKWGNLDENLLYGVITVKFVKLGGKNWNLLFKIYQICPPCVLCLSIMSNSACMFDKRFHAYIQTVPVCLTNSSTHTFKRCP
jgi:hypothetical protein